MQHCGLQPREDDSDEKGENLEQDFAFIDEYIKEKTKQVPAGSSPPTPMNNDKTLVDLLQMPTKSTSKKDSKKKRKNAKKKIKSKVFETSSDESSTSTDSDSDSSEEPRRKRRKTKKKSKSGKKRSRHEYIESETTSESDKSFVPLEISEEEDNDPNHGTIQKSKLSKPKMKKSAPRQPQAKESSYTWIPPHQCSQSQRQSSY